MRSRSSFRAFLISFVCTALVLLLFVGILFVDAEGRRLSFNDNTPPFEILYAKDGSAVMQVHAFALEKAIPVTGAVKVWRFLQKFFCLP